MKDKSVFPRRKCGGRFYKKREQCEQEISDTAGQLSNVVDGAVLGWGDGAGQWLEKSWS